VCGGPGSGKTQIVAALAAASPSGERVVSVEEIAELAIARDEWIQLEARPGTGRQNDVDMTALLEMALRFMPDRLVVGEVRGREALSLVHALNAQCDGAVVAMSGEGANHVLNRLATLVRSAQLGNDGATRELVASSFEIVIDDEPREAPPAGLSVRTQAWFAAEATDIIEPDEYFEPRASSSARQLAIFVLLVGALALGLSIALFAI